MAFAYATKHYLRGEDGLDWEDYAGILPASAARLARGAYAPANKDYRYREAGKSGYTSYAATEFTSRRESGENTGTSTPGGGVGTGVELDVERGRVRDASADATKRIRVKRSKDRLKGPGKTAATPLMSSLQHTIDFSTDPDALSTPLPMVYVASHLFGILLTVFVKHRARALARTLQVPAGRLPRDGRACRCERYEHPVRLPSRPLSSRAHSMSLAGSKGCWT